MTEVPHLTTRSYECVTLPALILVNILEIGSTSTLTRQDLLSETLCLWHKLKTPIVAISRIHSTKLRGFELFSSGPRVSRQRASVMFVSQRLLQQQLHLLGSPVFPSIDLSTHSRT